MVEGPIGSGKSTLAKLLANQFHAHMFSEKAERNSTPEERPYEVKTKK